MTKEDQEKPFPQGKYPIGPDGKRSERVLPSDIHKNFTDTTYRLPQLTNNEIKAKQEELFDYFAHAIIKISAENTFDKKDLSEMSDLFEGIKGILITTKAEKKKLDLINQIITSFNQDRSKIEEILVENADFIREVIGTSNMIDAIIETQLRK